MALARKRIPWYLEGFYDPDIWVDSTYGTVDRKLLDEYDARYPVKIQKTPPEFNKVSRFRPTFKFFFSFWLFNFFLLGVLGGKPVEYPFSELGVVASVYYFFFFFFYF